METAAETFVIDAAVHIALLGFSHGALKPGACFDKQATVRQPQPYRGNTAAVKWQVVEKPLPNIQCEHGVWELWVKQSQLPD